MAEVADGAAFVPRPMAKEAASEHITVVEPTRGWRSLDFAELWKFRELLFVLTMRDVKVRYKQTALGATWAIVQPFMTMVVFSLVFGSFAQMPSDGVPYPVFVYAALLPWTFFASSVTSASGSLVGSSHLISKVYFPRLIIPLSSVGVGLIDFAVASSILLGMMFFYDVGWSFHLLAIPALLLTVVFVALGVGTLLCALTVTYRDFRFVVPFMVQFWMFATPVVYPASLVPEQWRWLLFLNPMAGLIEGFRSSFLDRPFDLFGLSTSIIVATAMFVVGVAYFGRVERRFADRI